MQWNKIDEHNIECITPHWYFILEANPNKENILYYLESNKKKILIIEEDVRRCFYFAYDLNLKSERNE